MYYYLHSWHYFKDHLILSITHSVISMVNDKCSYPFMICKCKMNQMYDCHNIIIQKVWITYKYIVIAWDRVSICTLTFICSFPALILNSFILIIEISSENLKNFRRTFKIDNCKLAMYSNKYKECFFWHNWLIAGIKLLFDTSN
jgi:hypothetical protein